MAMTYINSNLLNAQVMSNFVTIYMKYLHKEHVYD